MTETSELRGALLELHRVLLNAQRPGGALGACYLRALQEHPEVVLAHRDVTAAVGT